MLRDVIIRLIFSALGIVISISAFFTLFIFYRNDDVGFISAVSGALAGVCFHLHWVRGKETLERWHTKRTLDKLHIVGFLSALCGTAALIGYTFLTFYYKIPIQPISESTTISAVWSLICAKWGITLMYYTNKYALLVEDETGSILTDTS
ncbi:uncharacterized protein LOC109854268 [Pseudomyrmex gracilis]|uniref:uncharacterized protein LOC109854268 n=1 Tax=Pseudomyrmex gracilis TaxID=219809 RepID=UPI0009955A01|nr:uncharacterized protein LOC109854268 [Pseudomyrmex gracilis]